MPSKAKINQCIISTQEHISSVRTYLSMFVVDLINRSDKHDTSKMEDPELSIFAEYQDELALTEYGSEEYEKLLEKVKPAVDNHYSKNRHHPEHWPNGVSDMTLVDLMEMIADWKASSARNKDGNIRKSIETCAKKYKISPQLAKIFDNTIREYFSD